jgi:hypothetical protein
LTEYEQRYPVITKGEEYILHGIEALGMLGSLGLAMLAVLFNGMTSASSFEGTPRGTPPQVIALFIAMMAVIFMTIFTGQIGRFRVKHSPSIRENFKKSIDDLSRRLDSHDRSPD